MYRFQIRATTEPGEIIALVGSTPELGEWDVARCVRLQTQGDRYPLWWADVELAPQVGDRPAEYKYARLHPNGRVEWEAWGSNRWVPIEPAPLPSLVVVEDGELGIVPPWPYGYFADPVPQVPLSKSPDGLKIAVIGSSVALGCNAWLLRGWAWHLANALHCRFGHQVVNVSELGANVGTTITRFPQVIGAEQPDIVIIALSLGNEGLATSAPHHHRAIQRYFENGLQQLIKMTRDLGAQPILGGVYPHGHYTADHARVLYDTHHRMLSWDVPVLNWLEVLADGQGRWKPGIASDPAHPNSKGHQLMYEAINLTLFPVTKGSLPTPPPPPPPEERPIYQDPGGFAVIAHTLEKSLRAFNPSPYPYTIAPDWQDFQTAFRAAQPQAGLYIADDHRTGGLHSLFVQDDSTIGNTLTLSPATDLTFLPAFQFFTSQNSQLLFYDGQLSMFRMGDRHLYVINQSDHDYNLHPMWKAVRTALKAMPPGVYEDPSHPDQPFRTLMIGEDGLESRVKVPAQSAIALTYRCPLSAISRVAILSLGDRCATRMLLYKMEYDGPAFPFDLTRTTNLSDVADIIQSDFSDMWNPAYLYYDHAAHRIYHMKWTGLSFAHEIEDSDDPVRDMTPVYERMRTRYSARAERFRYTVNAADEVLFVRTGLCDRAAVMDLLQKLEARCPGKPFRLLIISPQPSEEFADLPNVVHYDLLFNPDRMYDDLAHWLYCTGLMRDILTDLGISSKNLFWCPPTPPQGS